MTKTLIDEPDITDLGFERVSKAMTLLVDTWYATKGGIVYHHRNDGYFYLNELGTHSLDIPFEDEYVSNLEISSERGSEFEIITASKSENKVQAHYEDGSTIWTQDIESPNNVVGAGEELLVVGTVDGEIIGLDQNFDGIELISRSAFSDGGEITTLEANESQILASNEDEIISLTLDNEVNYRYQFDSVVENTAAIGEFSLVQTTDQLFGLNSSGEVEWSMETETNNLSSTSEFGHFCSESALYVVSSSGEYSTVLEGFDYTLCQLNPSNLLCIEENNYFRIYKRENDYSDLKTNVQEGSGSMQLELLNTTNHTFDQITLILDDIEVKALPGVDEFDIYDLLPGDSDFLVLSASGSEPKMAIGYQNEILDEVRIPSNQKNSLETEGKQRTSTDKKKSKKEDKERLTTCEDLETKLDNEDSGNGQRNPASSTNESGTIDTNPSSDGLIVDISEVDSGYQIKLDDNDSGTIESPIQIDIEDATDTFLFQVQYDDEPIESNKFEKNSTSSNTGSTSMDSGQNTTQKTDSEESGSHPNQNQKRSDFIFRNSQFITGGVPDNKDSTENNSTEDDGPPSEDEKSASNHQSSNNQGTSRYQSRAKQPASSDIQQADSDESGDNEARESNDENPSAEVYRESKQSGKSQQHRNENYQSIDDTNDINVERTYIKVEWGWKPASGLELTECEDKIIEVKTGEPLIEVIEIEKRNPNLGDLHIDNLWDEESDTVIPSTDNIFNKNNKIKLYSITSFYSESIFEIPSRVFRVKDPDEKYTVKPSNNSKKIRVKSYRHNKFTPQHHYIKNQSSKVESNLFIRFPWDVPRGKISKFEKSVISQKKYGSIKNPDNSTYEFEKKTAKIGTNLHFPDDDWNGNGLTYKYELNCPNINCYYPNYIYIVVPLLNEEPNYAGSNFPDKVIDGLNREDEINSNLEQLDFKMNT